ncbi:MAG: 6-carboxytetrahydropterin synthase [Myxococcota bacterium]|nr:6-carboxytetrahydropterin synthase [Myxococcota bacterium]
MATFRSSKTFRNYPCSHRRWRHDGHCAHIHGYSREFIAWFACEQRTENGFVMDFGALKPVKAWLDDHFDHTLLLDDDDPLLPEFRQLAEKGACKLVTFADVGMEGTAEFVFNWLDSWVKNVTQDRVWLVSLEVRENDKNSAIYTG